MENSINFSFFETNPNDDDEERRIWKKRIIYLKKNKIRKDLQRLLRKTRDTKERILNNKSEATGNGKDSKETGQKCSRCDETFEKLMQLMQHMNSIYEAEIPINVQIKDKSAIHDPHGDNSNKQQQDPVSCRLFLQGRCKFAPSL